MMPAPAPRLWPALLLLGGVAALVAGWAAWKVAVAGIAQRLDASLVLTARTVEAEVERFRYLPGLALEDPRVRAAVAEPGRPDRIAAANAALAVAARQSGAGELYLLDAGGTTLASSNWREPGSFVGENYAFRPYFRDALRLGAGRFYAVGVTTGEPGYFLASRGVVDGVRAVMVVKVDLRPLQATWTDAGGAIALADRYGIVILSGDPGWLYRPVVPLDPGRRHAIAEARAYATIAAEAREPILPAWPAHGSATLDGADGPRLLRTRELPVDSWQLVAASSLGPALRTAGLAAAGALLAALALGAMAQARLQRRRLVALRLRQGEILEQRVAERTEALAREVAERRRAEADLREAQDALLHSEKMAALGRMSAAIVHEISQPLAAMEASLAAAVLSGKIEDAPSNARIEKARGNIRRILRTIKHLKSFARREPGERRPVAVDDAIAGALELVAPRSASSAAHIAFAPEGPSPVVVAGQVRLEQVLVNLLMNALDAVAGREGARIEVERRHAGGRVEIAVTDNGPGIPAPLLPRVSEPFFSTKTSGEGLGLGLSVSRTIVEEFGGRLDLGNRPGGGLRAVLSLDPAPDQRVAAE